MAGPLSPEEEASLIGRYWGTDAGPVAAAPPPPAVAPIDLGDIDAPTPYQPNPGAPGYNPNPVAAPPPAPRRGDPVAGAIGKAFSSSEPVFQNPFASPKAAPPQAPIDLGDIDAPAPKAAMPTGPTPAEDAALARFNASVAEPPRPVRSTGPGLGAGTKPNPDPYGIQAAQRKIVGSYDAQRGATEDVADDQAAAAADIGAHRREMARRRFEDSDIAVQEANLTQQRLGQSLTEAQGQLDDLRSRRIRPALHPDTATGLMSIAGGILGGLYQWSKGLDRNPFLDELNRQIDRQISIDDKNNANERDALQGKMNLLQQQRAIFHDDQLSKLAARNLYYEAFKDELQGLQDQHDVPMYRDRARLAIAEVDREQGKVQDMFGRQAQQVAASAAARDIAMRKEVRDFRAGLYDKLLHETGSPSYAEAEADRQTARGFGLSSGFTPRPADPEGMGAGGMGKEHRQKLAAEDYVNQRASDEFNSQIDALKKDPALKGLGVTTGMTSKLGPRVAPGATRTVQDLHRINTQVLQAVGKVAKDADGKPNAKMIDKIEKEFGVDSDDTEELAIQKLEGARSAVNALARQQGAGGAPKPNAAQDRADKVGFRPGR